MSQENNNNTEMQTKNPGLKTGHNRTLSLRAVKECKLFYSPLRISKACRRAVETELVKEEMKTEGNA